MNYIMSSPLRFYIPIFIAIIVFGFISMYFNKKANSKATNEYLEKYPEVVKVFLKHTNIGVANSHIEVASVDGLTPARFSSGMEVGIYVKVGKSVVNAAYLSSRVGVLHKNVTTYTDYTPIELDLVAGKDYELSFDKKEGFIIKEK